MRNFAIVMAAVALVFVAGCSEPSVEEAQADLCVELLALNQAVGTLGGINATSTVSEYEDALKAVDDALAKASSAADDVQAAQVAEAEAAVATFKDSVGDISSDELLAAAAETVVISARQLRVSINDISTQLDCTEAVIEEGTE